MTPLESQPERALQKLDPCSDKQCGYLAGGKCAFGLRHMGCFMEEGAAKTMAIAMGATPAQIYEYDSLHPEFKHVPTSLLNVQEQDLKKRAEEARELARTLEMETLKFHSEQNYRKHIKTLKPMSERKKELSKIINDPSASKTARIKAEREYNNLDKAFQTLLRSGEHCEPKKE